MEIKYTYENKLIPLLLNTVWINLLSIGSVYYSLEGLLGGDVFVIVFYVGGGVCGKWLAIKKIDNIRGKIFKFIFRTWPPNSRRGQIVKKNFLKNFGKNGYLYRIWVMKLQGV